MIYEIRKFIAYILILSFINISFQPLYAVPVIGSMEDSIEELLPKKSPPPPLKVSKPQPPETDLSSTFLGSVKFLFNVAYEGVKYALENPAKTLTVFLGFQMIGVLGGNEFQVNQGSLINPAQPSAAFLNPGYIFAAWDQGSTDSWFRMVGPSGPLTNEFPFNSTAGQAYQPLVSPTSPTSALVFYDGIAGSLRDQLYNSSGAQLKPIYAVAITSGGGIAPDAASSPTGQKNVVWYKTGAFNQVFGQVVNASGYAQLPSDVLLSPSGQDSCFPKIRMLPNGSLGIVYEGNRSGIPNIFMGTFTSTYAPIVNETQVAPNDTTSRTSPDLDDLSDDTLVLTYNRDNASEDSIIGVRLNGPDLTPLTNTVVINQPPATTVSRSLPRVRVLPSTFFSLFPEETLLFLWVADPGSDPNIHARLMTRDLSPLTDEFLVNQNTTGNQINPFLTISSSSSEVFFIWTGDQEGGDKVYGRFFNSTDLEAMISTFPPLTSTSTSTTGERNDSSSKIGLGVGLSTGICIPLACLAGIIWYYVIKKRKKTSDPETRFEKSVSTTPSVVPTAPSALPAAPSAVPIAPSALPTEPPSPPVSNSHPSEGETKLSFLSSSINSPTPFPRSSRFTPTSTGFSNRPNFTGTLNGGHYEIWGKLTEKEAKALQYLTAKPIQPSGEDRQKFEDKKRKNKDPNHPPKFKFYLGRGAFGTTYIGKDLKTGEHVAIKVVTKEGVNASLLEGENMSLIGRHPYVLFLRDYIHYRPVEGEESLNQVLDLAYCTGDFFRSMLTGLNSNQREQWAGDSFAQLMLGLAHIHNSHVVHSDVKGENILYMQDGTLRIADFGTSRGITGSDFITNLLQLGDKRKFSPEIIAFMRYFVENPEVKGERVPAVSGKGADMFAAALYIFELLTDDPEFFGFRIYPTQTKIQLWTYDYFDQLIQWAFKILPEGLSKLLLETLEQALAVNPEKRITPPQAAKKIAPYLMKKDNREPDFRELIKKKPTSSVNPQPVRTKPNNVGKMYGGRDPKLYLTPEENLYVGTTVSMTSGKYNQIVPSNPPSSSNNTPANYF